MRNTLSRQSRVPLYHQIKEELTARIEMGEFAEGDQLTTETELVAHYGTSRDTVREALKVLERDGHVERIRGKGTFVRKGVSRPTPESGNSIAVLIPDITIYVFTEILSQVEAKIREAGFDLMLYITQGNVEKEEKFVGEAIRKGVKGLVIAPSLTSRKMNHYDSLRKHDIPFVFVDAMVPYMDADYVVSNNVTGAQQAVSHMLSSGLKRIAHVAGPQVSSTARDRFEGYKRALMDHGVPLDMNLVRYTNFTTSSGHEAGRQILSEPDVEGIFGANCWVTVGTLDALEESNEKVDHILVGTFDAIEYSFYSHRIPDVVVAQPCSAIGDAASDILIRRICDNKPQTSFEQIVLEPHLLVRDVATMRDVRAGSITSGAGFKPRKVYVDGLLAGA